MPSRQELARKQRQQQPKQTPPPKSASAPGATPAEALPPRLQQQQERRRVRSEPDGASVQPLRFAMQSLSIWCACASSYIALLHAHAVQIHLACSWPHPRNDFFFFTRVAGRRWASRAQQGTAGEQRGCQSAGAAQQRQPGASSGGRLFRQRPAREGLHPHGPRRLHGGRLRLQSADPARSPAEVLPPLAFQDASLTARHPCRSTSLWVFMSLRASIMATHQGCTLRHILACLRKVGSCSF